MSGGEEGVEGSRDRGDGSRRKGRKSKIRECRVELADEESLKKERMMKKSTGGSNEVREIGWEDKRTESKE